MNAKEIRELQQHSVYGRADGSMDEENTRNFALLEIAAQLAEWNERQARTVELNAFATQQLIATLGKKKA
jgi:hypothetical protein